MSNYNTPKKEPRLRRRSFLKGLAGVGAGSVLGYAVLPPVARRTDEVVSDVTGRPTGNAGVRRRIQDECSTEEQPRTCESSYELTSTERFETCVLVPINEELLFRAGPSIVFDHIAQEHVKSPVEIVKEGTNTSKFSIKEVVAGIVSSIVFGAAHNFTSKGVDTKTIPSSQTMGGFALWGLMRKFGIGSSVVAHGAFNYRATSKR